MEILNQVLYWISTGLMLPVVVILLFLFLKSLAALGGFYGAYVSRLKVGKLLEPFMAGLSGRSVKESELPSGRYVLLSYFDQLLQAKGSEVRREKILSEFELEMSRKLSATKNMSKLGPILGLMGTLIPMGPALVGLASGDIASMAENMQVAFSTTVVGLIVGAIGFTLTEIRQRWFAKDLASLQFVADLITEENEKA
ncbi:MotA/TolQ/ExbB proton channel family protein [Algoriphagus jejuensis]|uniref:MotA/TolQ/ExbB proton channel family protein n=1 Tax=Algoriphagus jejuensis TaxID=419934 RepID=A0ABP3YDU9_9BACT